MLGQGRGVVRGLARLIDEAAVFAHIMTELVERREAEFARPHNIGGIEVERDAEQLAADHLDDLRVDRLVRHLDLASDDGGRAADAACQGVLALVHGRVQEGREQRHLLRVARRVDEGDGLVDHGVADAIHGAGELVRNAGIDVRIVAAEAVRRTGDAAG